ncbi:hypothetical protein D1007_59217 [Hordeum vulgare]|nr:hypothetical protein D1007_59217 [Hordeum vulgare]
MPSFGSRSNDDLDPEYKLALRIALEQSKVETGGAPDRQPRRFPSGAARIPVLAPPETDARRLRRKNAKAPRIAIEQSKHEATEAARLAKLKREQDREVRRLKGLVILSDDDDDDHDSSSDSPLAVDSYSCVGDRKGKGPARKW